MSLDAHDNSEPNDPWKAGSPAATPPDALATQFPASAIDILDRIVEAFLILDREWRIVYANREACRINQKPLREFQGKTHWEEWPASIGTEVERQYRRAMDERVEVHFEHRYVLEPYDVWMEIDAYPTEQGLSLFYRDVTARKRAEQALQQSAAHLRQLVDAIPNIAWTTNVDGDLDYLNKQWRVYTGVTDLAISPSAWREIIHPDDLADVASAWTEARDAGGAWGIEYRLRRADGAYRWHVGRSEPVKDAAGAITMWVGSATDIEERKQAEKELRRSREDLLFSVSAARLGTFYCEWPLDKIVWNETCKEHFFLPADAEVDFDLFYSLLHPEDREPTQLAIERAMTERTAYDVEYRTLASDGRTRWVNAVGRFYYGSDGNPIRFDGITIDISARKENEAEMSARAERERFLAKLAERARMIADPDEVIQDAVRSVGQFLGVGRCVFGDIDLVADTCTILADYCEDSVASIVGVFPFSAFGPFVVAEYQAGRPVSVEDVRLDPLRVIQPIVAGYEAMGIRAHITAPVVHSSRLVSVIAVHSATPRRWKPEEVELLQSVVERTWLIVEVLRQQAILANEAAEQRARAEREALLNRIGQALRVSRDPAAVLETAVRELGQALGADRCYYASYDRSANTATVGPDWSRAELSPLAGRYPISDFAINRDPRYQAGHTQVVADMTADPATLSLGIHALVRAPLVSGAYMTALSVAMSNGPRQWTPEEISLVEAVATQTQTALESARVQRREHNIAEQLQSALQPALPKNIPGLEVSSFTRPALDEASVGGDFFDVFSLDKELYALIIADVSGKGLAAAQQLALIRNSLRTTLYLHPAPAAAATALNKIVTTHDLLVGFVTAFVGVYDAATGTITYASCGHEPGLVRRATGPIAQLEATGPPLGIAETSIYGESAVTLAAEDTLLLYTDGLSEAGQNRRELLGVGGLTNLFDELPAEMSPQEQAEALIAAVSEYAGGGFRDDVAVLVARRQ